MKLHADNIQEKNTTLFAQVDENDKQQHIEVSINAAYPKKNETPISSILHEAKNAALFKMPIETLNHEAALKATSGSKELLQELLSIFFNVMSEELKNLADAHNKHDWERIRVIAHKIIEGCWYCGAQRLEAACIQLDIYIRKGETVLSEQFYKRVLNEIDFLKQHCIKIKVVNDSVTAG